MKKYKVYFEGFAYVQAENLSDAEDRWGEGELIYTEQTVSYVEEVDEFSVEV